MHAFVLSLPAATTKVIPAAMERWMAASNEADAPPPRLIFATAGKMALAVTQSMPAITPPPGTKAVTIQHPHRMDGHAFGYPIGRAAHSPRDVGSVAVAIFDAEAVVDGGRAAAHPARKFVVACAQARVQNIDVDTHSIHGIGVGTVQRQGVLVEPVQPPGG